MRQLETSMRWSRLRWGYWPRSKSFDSICKWKGSWIEGQKSKNRERVTPPYPVNSRKALKFLIPTQLLIKGQWWSYITFHLQIEQYSHRCGNARCGQVCIFGFLSRRYEFMCKGGGYVSVDFWLWVEVDKEEAYFWCGCIGRRRWSTECKGRSLKLWINNIFPIFDRWSTEWKQRYCFLKIESCSCDSKDAWQVCEIEKMTEDVSFDCLHQFDDYKMG